MNLVITCEHAFHTIPEEYNFLFLGAEAIQESHLGFDPGAYNLFEDLQALSDFSFFQTTGRLLVEVNRSLTHPLLFSEFTNGLSDTAKAKLLIQHYFPYRNLVENQVTALLEKGEKVLHFSVHTFTPKLNGIIRETDIGLLYDPARADEKGFSRKLQGKLRTIKPPLTVRLNYPYLGKSDGFTTYLRRKFPSNYLGIELEVNQHFVRENNMDPTIKKAIFEALQASLK